MSSNGSLPSQVSAPRSPPALVFDLVVQDLWLQIARRGLIMTNLIRWRTLLQHAT